MQEPEDPTVRLKTLGAIVQHQITNGPHNDQEFENYVAELDELKGQFEDQKSKPVLQLMLLKLRVLLDIFEDCDASAKVVEELEATFTDGENRAIVESLAIQIDICRGREVAREALVGRPAPDIEFSWCSEKNLKSLSQIKDKVIVLDFWRNTSQASVGMFATNRRLQDRFTGLDVEIIGVTHPVGMIVGLRKRPMDFAGKPSKELRTLAKYRKAKDINWTLAGSENPVFLRDYVVTKFPSMVIIDPAGVVRHVDIRDDVAYLTRAEMIDKLLKEFGKTTSGLVR